VGARHGGKLRGAFQADRNVAERGERLEIAPGPTAEIEDRERGRPSMYCNSAAMFWLTS
jgi:hypothetical protein